MFYLETKDGERFFTAPKSNDRIEFEKIVRSKMGDDSVKMLDELLQDARSEGAESVCDPDKQVVVYYCNIDQLLDYTRSAIKSLNQESPDIDQALAKLNEINTLLRHI